MSTEIISPLAQIVRRAAESTVEGPIGLHKRRMADATEEVVLLADTSSSMDDTIGSLEMSKYDHLLVALRDVLQYHPKIRIISFGTLVKVLDKPQDLPLPGGDTPLAKALTLAQKFKPRKTIIISDGCPTDGDENVRQAAQKLTGVIDTIYCGADGHPAIEFLHSLAKECAGRPVTWNGYSEISSHIRGLIGAPAK